MTLRKIDENLRLQSGMNIFGQIEGGRIFVHRRHQPEQWVCLDLDSSDNRFHVAAIIEERSETCPAFLAHAVPFVENNDPSAQHRGHQRRSDISKLRLALNDGRNEKILRPGVDGGLKNINFAAK